MIYLNRCCFSHRGVRKFKFVFELHGIVSFFTDLQAHVLLCIVEAQTVKETMALIKLRPTNLTTWRPVIPSVAIAMTSLLTSADIIWMLNCSISFNFFPMFCLHVICDTLCIHFDVDDFINVPGVGRLNSVVKGLCITKSLSWNVIKVVVWMYLYFNSKMFCCCIFDLELMIYWRFWEILIDCLIYEFMNFVN